jgi:hypothetical protein
MPKKTRTTQQQRARQEQWRRRVDAQIGGETTRPNVMLNTAVEDASAEDAVDGSAGYQQAEMRRMPANVSTGSATRAMNRLGGAATMPTAGQRRSTAASRATRGRIMMNTMSLEEEMHYVRADIRKLIILTAACLAIIIVLAFVINML